MYLITGSHSTVVSNVFTQSLLTVNLHIHINKSNYTCMCKLDTIWVFLPLKYYYNIIVMIPITPGLWCIMISSKAPALQLPVKTAVSCVGRHGKNKLEQYLKVTLENSVMMCLVWAQEPLKTHSVEWTSRKFPQLNIVKYDRHVLLTATPKSWYWEYWSMKHWALAS